MSEIDEELKLREETLRDLFAAHEELHQAYHKDATVHAWFKMYLQGHCTLVEAYLGIIAHLVLEKQKLWDAHIKLMSTQQPAPVLLPHNAILLNQDESGGQPLVMPKLEKGSRIELNNFGSVNGTYVVTKVKGDSLSLELEK